MVTTNGKQCLQFRVVQVTDRYIRLRVSKVQGPVCHITCNVETVGVSFDQCPNP